ncbi:TIGR03905 family TSCPD domain-containing protein [Crassaminicella profunda]|uniref:TIGR03905 family TSCPD domain-containing protein n=1 Tax=Crassaminicella profunda TaxID=1286698 RepID=UPI001CA65D77|nr:TIGR03905 family TSCPD domain-containing protein [Crassaminicella profunda]QZY56243.1 TIGR03905 family TSCPD domain-containing protein [Crassaminicella profunda]
MYVYKTAGVCAKEISFSVENNMLKEVKFHGGCPGNTLGLSILLEGMSVDEAIQKLTGIRCGNKSTSCPDQLSKALMSLKKEIA